MTSIKASPFFNSPQFAQAAANLSSLFEPPSGADAAGWAEANSRKAAASRLADFYDYAKSPNYDQATADRLGVGAGIYQPNQSYYSVNLGDQTTRRGQDVTAATSRANNADDNARSIQTNSADNARALETNRVSELGKFFQPLSEGQVRPEVPSDIAGNFGVAHDLPAAQGRAKALSETEVQGDLVQKMRDAGLISDEMVVDRYAGEKAPVQAVVDGRPTFMSPGAAVRAGAQPVETKGQTINVGGNNDIGTIPAGMQVIRDAQGNVAGMKPIPGGPAAKAEADGAAQVAAKGQTRNTSANIVVDDIDRALAKIDENPMLNTGVGAAITGAVPGTPAFNTSALIDTVKANAGFDKLQAMREASPTGGALGAVSDAENHMLQAAIGNLSTSQDRTQLQYNLKRVSNIYRDIIDGLGNGQRYDLKTGALVGGSAPAQGSGPSGVVDGTVIQNSAGDKMVRRGGKWEAM
ncbi:hypothetical protein C7I87_28160 [Mesorhizobium sp. SARCC-RB16n]|uniref:hypothetical protein n=1 Tax=Mesorhizobium sp. SARCC-RB16n TaxID=2116687 RepID=UPI00122EC412|nr:hypothetical protein [Mesorhizobium sp. SARCC-RB16n]KAA3447134.1 hypothetical protein C7I87_28160 [Mesorhizobium sp. SARCC-RB16n]